MLKTAATEKGTDGCSIHSFQDFHLNAYVYSRNTYILNL